MPPHEIHCQEDGLPAPWGARGLELGVVVVSLCSAGWDKVSRAGLQEHSCHSHNFSGHPVPGPSLPHREEFHPYIQSKPVMGARASP